MQSLFTIFVAALALSVGVEAKLKEGQCEVCLAAVNSIVGTLTPDIKKDEVLIEGAIEKYCASLKPSQNKEERWCYYIGGSKDSATRMIKEISTPMKNSLPAERICEKLMKTNGAVCDLKFERKVDLKTVDLKKLRVKELKKILSQWDEKCDGCVEKGDYVRRIEALKLKHTEL